MLQRRRYRQTSADRESSNLRNIQSFDNRARRHLHGNRCIRFSCGWIPRRSGNDVIAPRRKVFDPVAAISIALSNADNDTKVSQIWLIRPHNRPAAFWNDRRDTRVGNGHSARAKHTSTDDAVRERGCALRGSRCAHGLKTQPCRP
jgi:hypothetical protein